MILNLPSAMRQLPPEFLPSVINRLSPKTYINLRRTCSAMDTYAEEHATHIRVIVANTRLKLEFVGETEIVVYFNKGTERFRNFTTEIEDISTIRSFVFKYLWIDHSDSDPNHTNQLVHRMEQFLLSFKHRYGKLCLLNFPDPYHFLALTDVITCGCLEICQGNRRLEPVNYEVFKDLAALEKFPSLFIKNCLHSDSCNLLDICKGKKALYLWYMRVKWQDLFPMYSRFIQWISTYLYYCESETKRMLLFVNPAPVFIHNKLYIIPIDDFSEFVNLVAYTLFGAVEFLSNGFVFPLDNSYLYSLLEGVTSDRYAEVLDQYTTTILNHMNEPDDEDCERW